MDCHLASPLFVLLKLSFNLSLAHLDGSSYCVGKYCMGRTTWQETEEEKWSKGHEKLEADNNHQSELGSSFSKLA